MQNNQNSYSIIWFFIRNGLGENINWEPGEAPQAYLQKNPLWDDDAYDASGTSVVPPYLCDCALGHGYRDPNSEYGTSDSFFRACAEEYGLNSARRNFITEEDASSSARASNKALFEDMKQFLATDSLIIVSVGESPYTGGGHDLAVYGIDDTSNIEDAKVWVADPNGHSEDYPNAILPANYCYTVRQWLDGYWAKRAIRIWP